MPLATCIIRQNREPLGKRTELFATIALASECLLWLTQNIYILDLHAWCLSLLLGTVVGASQSNFQ